MPRRSEPRRFPSRSFPGRSRALLATPGRCTPGPCASACVGFEEPGKPGKQAGSRSVPVLGGLGPSVPRADVPCPGLLAAERPSPPCACRTPGSQGTSRYSAGEELVSQAFPLPTGLKPCSERSGLPRSPGAWEEDPELGLCPEERTCASLAAGGDRVELSHIQNNPNLCWPSTAHLPAGRVRKETFPLRCSCHFFRAHLHEPVSVLRPPSLGVTVGVTPADGAACGWLCPLLEADHESHS